MSITHSEGSAPHRWLNLIRFALSDLRHRPAVTGLCIAATAMSCAYLLVLGHVGARVYEQQHEEMQQAQPTKIVPAVTDVTDRSRRFTDDRMAEMRRWPGVRSVVGLVELNVRVTLAGQAMDVPAESIVPNDPALSPQRLTWGAGVSGAEAREAVLSRSLFEKLGGRVVGRRVEPARVSVQVGRTVGGRDEAHAVELRMTGLVNESADKVYLPLQLADRLDLWCTHKLDRLHGDGKAPAARTSYPCGLVYVPVEHEGRVAAEADRLGVEVERLGEVAMPEEPRLVRVGPAHVTVVPHRKLVQFRVRDPRAGGLVGDELLAVLALSRPTFLVARPFLSVEGRIGAATLPGELVASGPTDPARFVPSLTAGSWLRSEAGPNQIVMPRSPKEPAPVIGTTVLVHFRRDGGETATVPLRVVGVVEGPTAFIPLPLANDVRGWRQGRRLFNETRQVFEEPIEVARRSGYVRCVVHAVDADAVGPLVTELRQRGYHTEDRLAEQEGLRRLGRLLVAVVGLFVLGCLVNAALTVLISTMMNVKSKTYEIGILRAHGLGSPAVVFLFAVQGLLIGLGSFALAAGLVLLGEPLLRDAVAQSLSAKAANVLAGSPFEPERWWLPALVLAVAVGFSLFGVAVPAAWACRLSPVNALRNRE